MTQDLVMTMPNEDPDYLSYLLRAWWVNDKEEAVWRASLESAHPGERKGFAGLEALFAFPREQTGVSSDVDGGGGETGK